MLLSICGIPAPPVASATLPILIPLTVLAPIEGIRILNGTWLSVEALVIVIKFAAPRLIVGDA